MAMTRDKWGALALAGSHFSMGIINRYPQTIRGYVQYQHETAQNTAQILKEEEEARQAAKKAHRLQNRMLIGGIAGAALGGVGGAVTGGSFSSIASGMQAGSSMGSSLAGGDISGFTSGLGQLGGMNMPAGGGSALGSAGVRIVNGQIIDNATGQVIGITSARGV